MPAGRRSPAAFPRPVRPTNITADVIEGACGTELVAFPRPVRPTNIKADVIEGACGTELVAFPRPVRPTNITADVIEGACGTELDSSSSNRPGQHSDVEGRLRPTDFRSLSARGSAQYDNEE